jgi:NACHT NTPase-like protein
MEPLAALGLVGNIITLIDFSSKLFNAASTARHSASGLPEDLQDAAVITKNLESFLTQLPAPTLPPTASAADKALAELTANCRTTCDQLNELVKKIKSKGSGSRRDSLRVAAKGLWHKDKLQELEKRLDSHRSQIMDHFHRIFQYGLTSVVIARFC